MPQLRLARGSEAGAAAMKHDGVRPEIVVILIESYCLPWQVDELQNGSGDILINNRSSDCC
jgi:hypothetical protein